MQICSFHPLDIFIFYSKPLQKPNSPDGLRSACLRSCVKINTPRVFIKKNTTIHQNCLPLRPYEKNVWFADALRMFVIHLL